MQPPNLGHIDPHMNTNIPLVEAVRLESNNIVVLLMTGAIFAAVIFF